MSSAQRWGAVFAAEFKRIVLRARTIVALAIFALVGIGITVVMASLVNMAQQELAGDVLVDAPIFVGLGLATSFVSFATSFLCVSSSARDYRDGAAAATLIMVPRRQRLLSARMVAWTVAAIAVSLCTLLPLAVMYQSMYERPIMAFAEMACGIVGTCVLVLVAFACTTLARRGAFALLAFLGIDFLVPTVLSVLSSVAPSSVGSVIEKINSVLPGQAVDTVMGVEGLFSGNAKTWAVGMVALVCWAAASIAASHFAFARYTGVTD